MTVTEHTTIPASERFKPDTIDHVEVDWIDSRQPVPAWQFADELEVQGPVRCTSVGYVLSEEGEVLVLAQSLADRQGDRLQVMGVMEIPKRAIIEVRHGYSIYARSKDGVI